MKPALLSEEDLQRHLSALPSWRVEGRELVTEFRFPSYLAGIEFVRQAAHCAEAMNHHPDLYVGWRKVGVRLATHSAGGLTSLDFELAGQLTALHPNLTAPG